MTYERHEAHVYKTGSGDFEVKCLTRGCRFQMIPKNIAGQPVGYAEAQRIADDHSRSRFRN